MTRTTALPVVPDEIVMNKIYFIRNHKVMLDSDLALLYDVETRTLNQAVSRHLNRFPVDFMFRLTNIEWKNLKSQIVTSSWGGTRHLPMAFTEHGVLMLSSVLKSAKAVDVNIQIMRIFTQIRKALTDNTELRLEIEFIKKKVTNHDKNIELVFQYLDELLEKKDAGEPRKQIGYKIPKRK